MSYTELDKVGQLPSGPIKDNIEKKRRHKAMQNNQEPTALAMGGVSAVDLGTGELLVPEVVRSLIAYAYKYDLDPVREHVVLMYGKPYVTLDGYLYHANRVNIPYTLQAWPMEEDKRKTYMVPDGAHAWLAEVIKGPSRSSFFGVGLVTQEEMTAKSSRDQTKLRSPVVAAHPWQLAQKRAEWQALRRAFPIGAEEPDQEEEIPAEGGKNDS
jgi:hypothetical protein